MQQIKKTADYTLFKKTSGRYAVKGKDKKWINGEEKEKILVAEQLVTLPNPKTPAPTETEAATEE